MALILLSFASAAPAEPETACANGSCGTNDTLPEIARNGSIQFAFGTAQTVGVSPNDKILDLMRHINSYMMEQDQEKCTMNYDQCIVWASTGECTNRLS